jgi:hypothetical protein
MIFGRFIDGVIQKFNTIKMAVPVFGDSHFYEINFKSYLGLVYKSSACEPQWLFPRV